MPAKTKDQRQAAGMALSAKRGETPVSELKGAAKDMYDSMSKDELEKMASKSSESVKHVKGRGMEAVYETVERDGKKIIIAYKRDLKTGDEKVLEFEAARGKKKKIAEYDLASVPGKYLGVVQRLNETI